MSRILFVAEEASLAQVVRLVMLAASLDDGRHEVHFACASFPDLVFSGHRFERHRIHSLPPERVVEATRKGRRPYDRKTLKSYIEEDWALLTKLRPDLVVGDLRLSLSVAAPLAGVPLASLVNAYWRPLANRRGFPLPDHPLSRRLGDGLASRLFPVARPFVFRFFASPLNHWRKYYGLRPLGSLPDALTFGDYVLYPDVPSLTPLKRPRKEERFLGPILWSPKAPWPERADREGRKRVYVTLGSSGAVETLPFVLEALGRLPVVARVATAGRAAPDNVPENALLAPYLPGDRAAEWADVVVCNGGATTAYQALAAGKPVVGIPSNLDQHLSMQAIASYGAGLSVRAERAHAASLASAIRVALEERRFGEAARRLSDEFRSFSPATRFRDFLAEAGCG